ncbi:hypothetical protein [Streptomyces sp. YIM B13508]|uniref:hypothetical protein n=1 Tax=Streptomyces sp. YIM B13508 TaxID=3366315 RepID=UPI0036999816
MLVAASCGFRGVGARLRERGGVRPTTSMFARLPAWMKASDNGKEVLAGLETLRALAERMAPADRSDAAHGRGCPVADRELVISRGDRAASFEAVDPSLDRVALAIVGRVEVRPPLVAWQGCARTCAVLRGSR